jgi:hypothetical protein
MLSESFARELIRKLALSISDKDKELTGIPLQTRMLADAFQEEFISFYLSEKSEPELPHKLDLLGLYGGFIDRKYDVYNREKSEKPSTKCSEIDRRKRDIDYIQLEHWRLALEALFTEDQVTILGIAYKRIFSYEELARIGIVQINNESKQQFIHRTFAEYYVAELLIKELTKETKQHTQVQEFLLNKVLLRTDCHVIRAFLDGFLEKFKPSNEALKEYGEKLNEQLQEKEGQGLLEGFATALHTAVKEDNANVIEFILKSLESAERLYTITKMLLARDDLKQTALHKAAENDSVQALKKIWEWAEAVTTRPEGDERSHLEASDTTRASVEEEELQPNQLKNKLLIAKDQYGNTAWHIAKQRDSLHAVEILRLWTKEAGINTNELLLG